jgi:uncharacterized lipoprotein YmbA
MTRIAWAGLCSGLILVGLVGCATTPSSNFFVLSAGEVPTQGSPSGIALSIGPVDLPRYLDRPQIVSREGDNRLEVDEFNRWGGALDEEISRALARQLGLALGTDRVFSYPSRLATDSDYRVALDIQTFDGGRGGDVTLALVWSLIDDRTGETLRTEQAVYTTTAGDNGVESYVVALSRLLTLLGNDLAVRLRAVSQGR